MARNRPAAAGLAQRLGLAGSSRAKTYPQAPTQLGLLGCHVVEAEGRGCAQGRCLVSSCEPFGTSSSSSDLGREDRQAQGNKNPEPQLGSRKPAGTAPRHGEASGYHGKQHSGRNHTHNPRTPPPVTTSSEDSNARGAPLPLCAVCATSAVQVPNHPHPPPIPGGGWSCPEQISPHLPSRA